MDNATKQAIRQNLGYDATDPAADMIIDRMPKSEQLRRALEWEGLVGGWDSVIRERIKDIYGVELED